MEQIGRYEILGPLAAGGMAEILLGRLVGPSGFERVVVIKRILPHLAREATFVQMFLDEARTVARIHHPNVVQVHELGREAGQLYLAMEYLEGESAAGLLRRLSVLGEMLDPLFATHIVAEACRGLHAAHELSHAGAPLDIVHRDISPQNLFITYGGAVKVLDFGIAKAADRSTRTGAGQVKGKYAYMSPEQCLGHTLDRRTDVFALGIVLHELLTRRRLFARATELLTMRAICDEPVPPPSALAPAIPPALDRITLRALARARDDRYPSAADLRRDLVAAQRTLDALDDPEDQLARLMRRVFADRIEEKREMLSRARSLGEVPHVAAAEPEPAIELPTADEAPGLAPAPPQTSTARSRAPLPPERGTATAEDAPTPRTWRRVSAGVLGVLAVLAASAFAVAQFTADAQDVGADSGAPARPPTGPAPADADATAALEERAAARPAPDAGPPPDAAVATAEAATARVPPPRGAVPGRSASVPPRRPPPEIALQIESAPPGARVTLGHRALGTTPLTVHLRRGSRPIEISLELAGHYPRTTTIKPLSSQRLMLTLKPLKLP